MLNEFVEGFDIELFLSMPSFAKKIRYANEKLQKLAVGSARIIYRIDDKKVLKLAKNSKGIAQNEVESDHLLNDWYGEIIAKVLESDSEDRWIISEFAKKVTPTRFKQLLGVTVDEFSNYLSNDTKTLLHFSIKDDVKKVLESSEFYEKVRDMVGNFDMEIGDFRRINSFGEIDGRLVIRDYGLTTSVYKQYYSRK